MSDNNNAVSRRQWVGMVSVPAIAGLIGASATSSGADDKSSILIGARILNIRDFGAKGDGSTLDTAAVQRAIDQAHAEKGAIVLVPAGEFVVGTLELKSNVTLHVSAGGKLLGSPRIEDYRAGNNIPRSNGNIVMISAADADNVTIEGRGTIDGNGSKFFTGRGDNTGPGQNSSEGYFQRPHLMVFYKCRNLLIRDVFLTASAYHCCRILQCRYVRADGVRIHNRVNKNNDGFHFNSSEYVNIINCNIACQDDACALFGSNRFVTITNCSFSTRWSIFRFGGGNPENIAISNCLIYETYGCPIKMRFGGRSRAQNISFANIVMTDVTGPITIGFDSRRRSSSTSAPTQPTTDGDKGFVRNITFNNIRASVVAVGRQHADLPFPSAFREGETRHCIVINGANPDSVIENISFTDIQLTVEGGGTTEEANRQVPAMAGEYFEIGTPPAHGIYARNARGLTFHNVRIEAMSPDRRPAIVFDHVTDATLSALTTSSTDSPAAVRLAASRSICVTSPRLLSPVPAFAEVQGDSSRITIEGGDIFFASKPVEFADGSSEKSVNLRP